MTEREELIYEFTFNFVYQILQPFVAVLKPSSLFFWPFILSTILIALLTFAFVRSDRKIGYWKDFYRQVVSPKIWLHPSARADYRYYFVNTILFPLIFAPILVSGALVAGEVDSLLTSTFGSAIFLSSNWVVNLLYTLLFFVLYDFGRYLGHYVQHRYVFLWQFHKVHHSAEVLTPFTNARAHPVDLICMWTFPHFFTGVLHGVFSFFFAESASMYSYFGLHIVIFAFNLISNLRHSHVWLSYGPYLSRILISPAQHQIHHSLEPKHFGCNIGFALAIWDGLFGTLYIPHQKENFKMGLGDDTEDSYHSVRGMYFKPFKEIFEQSKH